MDAELRGELERLRARAYGPEADLADDPDAAARLQHLEDIERRHRADSAQIPVAEDPLPVLEEVAADGDESESEEPPARPPVVRRLRTLWLWAASLAAVAAVTSAASIAATTFAPVARTAGIAQVGTLQPDPAAETEAVTTMGFDSTGILAFADYYGLTAYAGSTQIDSTGNTAECLLLVDTADVAGMGDDNSFRGGFRYGACGAGAFPATVEFVVTPELPDGFRQRFPVGSSVQFVRDGERVGVFSDAE